MRNEVGTPERDSYGRLREKLSKGILETISKSERSTVLAYAVDRQIAGTSKWGKHLPSVNFSRTLVIKKNNLTQNYCNICDSVYV